MSGTARTLQYLLTNEFPSNAAPGSITVGYMQDLIQSINQGTITPPVPAQYPTVRVTTSNTITQLSTDQVIVVNYPVSPFGVITVNLIAVTQVGQTLTIIDGTGCVETAYSFTVVPPSGVTINGLATYQFTTSFQSTTFIWNGTQWNCINNYTNPNQGILNNYGLSSTQPVSISYTRPGLITAYWDSYPFVLRVMARDVSNGNFYVSSFTCAIQLEAANSAVVRTSSSYGEINTTGGSGFIGFGSGTISLSFGSVSATASSFTLTATTTSPDNLNFWTTITDIM